MWIVFYGTLSVLVLAVLNGRCETHKRQKRYLIFTPATQWGVFATISIPLHPETTVSMAWFFEANYYTIDNATWYQPLLGDVQFNQGRSRRTSDSEEMFTRTHVYASIESMLQKHGYPGRWCLLRSICENASIHTLHNGVVGDLLHLILTPSSSAEEEELEDAYYEAEFYGKEDQCRKYYTNCPSSPLDFISVFIEQIK
ncbi:hypothetical protein ACJJTC_017202 [Scirpophaga incertulas]